MDKKTVLIVDDHTLIRDTWAKLLGFDSRFSVVGNTGDGNEAVEIAKEKHPELVLLDINMSPLNGFEVLKLVRKFSPGSKVIAVSMHAQPAYAKKMLNGGAKGYVTKNSSSDELLQAIDLVLNGQSYICKEVKEILVNQSIDADKGNSSLTEKELEVIAYLKQGLSSKEIAAELFITTKTVEVHRHNILKKLKLKNAAALMQYVYQQGL